MQNDNKKCTIQRSVSELNSGNSRRKAKAETGLQKACLHPSKSIFLKMSSLYMCNSLAMIVPAVASSSTYSLVLEAGQKSKKINNNVAYRM